MYMQGFENEWMLAVHSILKDGNVEKELKSPAGCDDDGK